ncbi:MoaD/ThiS family protein [Calidifontibacter sp. DB0510]|uniref:MoaD/ThiS family protein n=1 Tax=Metallococcus carri TaxID=1656884 RepID=A0A967EA47_9MICO|nr:MoaD/ThiS family protein [Metallococcus carri]NHN55504.1 MoaD/ThiS family protein [Metallococcus carri]NOP38312.1 MoaD/ThiS family protein [Calidifontibacter sp. DB2511S]
MAMPIVRYWAGAQEAAGVAEEEVDAGTVAQATAAVAQAHPALEPILRRSALLLDGRRVHGEEALPSGGVLEVLPPFAGG